MSECSKVKDNEHRHAGKSSERWMDIPQILSGLAISAGQAILDAGCGNGYMAKRFAELTGDTGTVYALDPDAALIDTLAAETSGTNIEPFVGDITQETKLPASSMDLIYLSTVIHGFSTAQMAGFLQEINRLLKPGGKLAIVEIKKEDTPFGPPIHIRFSPEELRRAVDLHPLASMDIGQYFYMQVFSR